MQVLAEIQERRGWRREIWGFDSFAGLPARQAGVDPTIWSEGQYATPFEEVQLRLQLNSRPWLRLVKGWFQESLIAYPAASIGPVAYARIDSDLYASCVESLAFLAPSWSSTFGRSTRMSGSPVILVSGWRPILAGLSSIWA